jgi:hypothetical protein
MATLRNENYTGPYDPNLASGIETARPEVKLGKQVFHEQPATKVNWQYPWPYTEMIMAQGGKVKPEQFLGRARPTDKFVEGIVRQQAEARQKARIEERGIDVKSNAEMDRMIKEYFMGEFTNKMGTRDLQYQLALLGEDPAGDRDDGLMMERQRLRERISQNERYGPLGALTNPQAARYLQNQQMMVDAVGRGDPLRNPGVTPLDAAVEMDDMCQARGASTQTDTPLSTPTYTPPSTPDETYRPPLEVQTPAEQYADSLFRRLEQSAEKGSTFESLQERDTVGVLEHTLERESEEFDRSPPANQPDEIETGVSVNIAEDVAAVNPTRTIKDLDPDTQLDRDGVRWVILKGGKLSDKNFIYDGMRVPVGGKRHKDLVSMGADGIPPLATTSSPPPSTGATRGRTMGGDPGQVATRGKTKRPPRSQSQ